LSHHFPVILVGYPARQAYLVMTAVVVGAWPTKLMRVPSRISKLDIGGDRRDRQWAGYLIWNHAFGNYSRVNIKSMIYADQHEGATRALGDVYEVARQVRNGHQAH
jgi:hypothetical protein